MQAGHAVFRAVAEPLAKWLLATDLELLLGQSFTFRSQPTLTPTPSGGTLLALEHSGFRPADAQSFEGAKQGWQRMLGELRGVLARA